MKNIVKFVLLALFAVGSTTVMAQQVKLGYLNSQELFSAMPEREAAFGKLQTYAEELENQLELIQVEFNKKFQEYQKDYTTMNEGVRGMKEKELQEIQNRLQESQQIAEQDLQRMQGELLSPVIDKMNEAIGKVAKENAITAVFDISAGAMIYHDVNSMVDMLPLAKKELGIQ